MTIAIATIVFCALSLFTLVKAFPTRVARQAPSPSQQILVSQSIGSTKKVVQVNVAQCVQVEDTKTPTAVDVENDAVNSYAFTAFSTKECSDDTIMHPGGMSLSSPVWVNDRQPICSFRLGRDTWPIYPVTVSFTFASGATQHYEELDNNTQCHDICNSSWESKYAHYVTIKEKDGRPANNHVHLFSGSGCQDTTRINYPSEISHGADLARLTQSSQGTARAFRITTL